MVAPAEIRLWLIFWGLHRSGARPALPLAGMYSSPLHSHVWGHPCVCMYTGMQGLAASTQPSTHASERKQAAHEPFRNPETVHCSGLAVRLV